MQQRCWKIDDSGDDDCASPRRCRLRNGVIRMHNELRGHCFAFHGGWVCGSMCFSIENLSLSVVWHPRGCEEWCARLLPFDTYKAHRQLPTHLKRMACSDQVVP
ncbi:uncharacterized protein [Physcomitrium patens]|uniref:uncharacterized protein n=1 Tax=Physcomitrium patens TaxID=3218 RepID=UPI003CCDFB64